MSVEDDWGEDCFYCHSCGKRFRSPLYDISREYEQTYFYEAPRLPEIDVMGAESIVNYCSTQCRNLGQAKIMQQENVRATFPDIGPVETCSRCGGPVDMTKFHLTYVASDTTQDWARPMFGVDVLDSNTLAVVCRQCAPVPDRIATAISWDEENSARAQADATCAPPLPGNKLIS